MTTSKRVERARLYFPGENGAVVTVTPVNGKKFLYKELSEAVGGMIESIRPAVQGHTVWANENGFCLGLSPHRLGERRGFAAGSETKSAHVGSSQ